MALGPLGDQNLLQCHILECHHTTLQCTSAHDQDKRIFPFHVSYHLSTVLHSDFHLLHTEKKINESHLLILASRECVQLTFLSVSTPSYNMGPKSNPLVSRAYWSDTRVLDHFGLLTKFLLNLLTIFQLWSELRNWQRKPSVLIHIIIFISFICKL